LKKGELNGLKLNKTLQGALYSGLIDRSYSLKNGSKTTELGFLLEKYNHVEPKPELILEALYLLRDPEGYRNSVKELGKTDSTISNVKKLKSAANDKSSAGSSNQEIHRPEKRVIQRRSNIFDI
jgi:hypothetical protein